MATIKHTLMREDLSTVNARQFSAERTDITIQMALDSIGGLYRTLLLTDEEDGIWTINNDITIPANVILEVPLGVTMVGPGDVIVLGGLVGLRWPIHLGPGVLTQDAAALGPAMSKLTVDHLTVETLTVNQSLLGLRNDTAHMWIGYSGEEFPSGIPVGRPGSWEHGIESYIDVTQVDHDYLGLGLRTVARVFIDSNAWIMGGGGGIVIDPQGHHTTGQVIGNGASVYIAGGAGIIEYAACFRSVFSHNGTAIVKTLAGIAIEAGDIPGGGAVENYRGMIINHPWATTEVGTVTIYGLHCGILAGTGCFNLYVSGTAINYIAARVGIGVESANAAYMLQLSGAAAKPGGGSWTDSASMAVLKTNIRPLTDALAQLLALQGRQWEWAPDQGELLEILPGTRVGFVIEEVESVRPAWVTYGDEEQKGLTISGFEALTVEAMRELAMRVQALEEAATN